MATTKARENRLRRMAERQGLRLEKSRRRDPLALDFGTWRVLAPDGSPRFAGDLDAIERWLTSPAAREEQAHAS